MVKRQNIEKLKITDGRASEICDVCHEKTKTYKLSSKNRNYRFLVVCENCLKKIKSGFKTNG